MSSCHPSAWRSVASTSPISQYTLGTTPATGAPVELKYGAFLQTLFDFLIIALVLFIVIRAINKLKKHGCACRTTAAAA